MMYAGLSMFLAMTNSDDQPNWRTRDLVIDRALFQTLITDNNHNELVQRRKLAMTINI